MLWDHETFSIWFGGAGEEGWSDLVCVEGPLQDVRLPRLDFRRTTWRSWHEEHPETLLMRRRP